MSAKDLIPLGQPGNEERDAAIRAKIKGSASPKRKLSQQIMGINKIKDPEKREARLLELVKNPEMSALQIQKVIDEVLSDEHLSSRTKVELIGKMVQAHTAIHGLKTKNLNLNVDMTSERVIERLKNWKKKELEFEVEDNGK